MTRSFTLLLLCASLLGVSCKKKELRDLEKAQARLEGTWTVSEIRLQVTDTLGTALADSAVADQGTVDFRIADGSTADPFNLAVFKGSCSHSELVNYFRSQNAGDPAGPETWALWWDADPEDMRVQLWGVNGGGSYHRGLNLDPEGKGKSAQTLFYVVEDRNQNLRTFYTWKMVK